MLGQFAVELGDHRRAKSLKAHPADARHDVVIDVVPVPGEGLGFHGCGVCFNPFGQVTRDGRC